MQATKASNNVFGADVLFFHQAQPPVQMANLVHLVSEDVRAPNARFPEQRQHSRPRRIALTKPALDGFLRDMEIGADDLWSTQLADKDFEQVGTVGVFGCKEHGASFLASDRHIE